MKKKKHGRTYKEGMKAGAAPFEEKNQEMADELRNTSSHMNQIVREQRKNKRATDLIIDDIQDIERKTGIINQEVKNNSENIKRQQQKIKNIEPMMSSVSTRCKSCGSLIEPQQLICTSCGTVTNLFPYKLAEFDISENCFKGVEDLAKTISDARQKEDDWLYPELESKFIKMKKINKIAYEAMQGKENTPIYSKIYNLSKKFFEDYRKKRIEIAVVGTVKAGKSSLINSLIGTRLASVDPTPETSILVKYRTTEKENYLTIDFYTQKEWNNLWEDAKNAKVFRNEYERLKADEIKYKYLDKPRIKITCTSEELQSVMMEWSKSDAPKHFFVKEIEVGYQSDTFPHDVYLVDTPGLSDPVRYRSDITRRYIKNSDWILACITGENLSGQPEFNFLSKVISNKGGDVSKIFVVATKKDMLTRNEVEKKQKEFLVRLPDLYNDNKEMAISRFSFVAAECHLLTKKVLSGEKISDEEDDKLCCALMRIKLGYQDINDKSDIILKYAGINDLFARINDIVLKKRRNYIIEDISNDYIRCMNVINENAASYVKDLNGYLDSLTANAEDVMNQIEELEKHNKEIAILQEKIESFRNNLEKEIEINSGK